MERIFLIGPPGAGKTACGKALAKKLSCPFFDTDQLIEAAEKRSVSAIFASEGEAHFRRLERELLEGLDTANEPGKQAVFATGGGLPVYNDNLQRLQKLGKVIALFADLPILVERVKINQDRPLLASGSSEEADKNLHDRLSELLSKRSPLYAQAGYKIDTSRLNPDQVADEIVRMLCPT